jgi:site-specific DNA recombinase
MVMAAGIYTRISDDRGGTLLGVTRQRTDCMALAERLAWPVGSIYEDNDVSAYSGKPRPAYRRMLEDLRGGRIDAIVAWHPDRLYRSTRDLEELIDISDACQASIQTVTAGTVDLASPTGRAVARTVGAWARFESEHKSERIRRQQAQLALSGEPSGGGTRPFGYASDRKTLDDAEAAVVREMAVRVLAGDSLRSLATDLNTRGVRTPAGNEWYPSVIRDLLLRPRYSGQRQYRGEVVAAAKWPAIISRSDAARLAALLHDPDRRKNRSPRRYLLTGGLLRCQGCEQPLVARPRADGSRRYVCAKGPALPGCGATFVLAAHVEPWVVEGVLHRLSSPHLVRALTPESENEPEVSLAIREMDSDAALLEEMAAKLGRREITLAVFNAFQAPVRSRRATNMAVLNRQRDTSALADLLGNPAGVREAYEGLLTLAQQRAVIAAVLDFATVGPAVRGRNRFDPARISPVWRV